MAAEPRAYNSGQPSSLCTPLIEVKTVRDLALGQRLHFTETVTCNVALCFQITT